MTFKIKQNHSSLTSDQITQKTYKCDLWRGGFEGILSSGAQTFCLFIAIRYFNAEKITKALIAAAIVVVARLRIREHFVGVGHLLEAIFRILGAVDIGV